jgi:DHA2 family multidrug resistance protein-like MFS transporter
MTFPASSASFRSESVTDGMPVPQRYWAILALGLAIMVAVLEGSIATIALPAISQDLHASAMDAIWVVNSYQVAIVLTLLPISSLGEILGYRLVYCWGIVAFAVGSIACMFAPTLPVLAVSRFCQGLGAAGIMGVNSALLRFIFPRAMLGRGIGYNAIMVAICSAAGPAAAAAILSIASWRWLFGGLVPFSVLAIIIGRHHLPLTARVTHRFDAVSALLYAVSFGALFLGAAAVSRRVPMQHCLPMIAVGLGGAYWLARHERGRARPLVPFDLLRIPVLRLSYASSVLAFGSSMIGLVALPFFLELRFGFTHFQTGLMISSMAVAIAVAAPIAGHLVERISPGALGSIGLSVNSAGWVIMAVLPTQPPSAPILVAMILCGVGFGLFQTPNNQTMVGSGPLDRSGAAGGMLALSRLVGQTCGALADVLLFELHGPNTRLTMWAAAVLVLIGACVSLRRASLVPSRQS